MNCLSDVWKGNEFWVSELCFGFLSVFTFPRAKQSANRFFFVPDDPLETICELGSLLFQFLSRVLSPRHSVFYLRRPFRLTFLVIFFLVWQLSNFVSNMGFLFFSSCCFFSKFFIRIWNFGIYISKKFSFETIVRPISTPFCFMHLSCVWFNQRTLLLLIGFNLWFSLSFRESVSGKVLASWLVD